MTISKMDKYTSKIINKMQQLGCKNIKVCEEGMGIWFSYDLKIDDIEIEIEYSNEIEDVYVGEFTFKYYNDFEIDIIEKISSKFDFKKYSDFEFYIENDACSTINIHLLDSICSCLNGIYYGYYHEEDERVEKYSKQLDENLENLKNRK